MLRMGSSGSAARRRLAPAALAGAIVAAVWAPAALAHVGIPKTVVAAGPYRLVISAAPVAAGQRSALAFHAVVSDRADGVPVDGALLRITVSEGARTLGVYRATGFAGIDSLLVPIPSADSWRSLRFALVVTGPLGQDSGEYVPPSLVSLWSAEPAVLALAAIGVLLFLYGFVRLRRRSRADHASLWRLVIFAAGLGLMVLPLVSPLDALGDRYLLSAHMLQHVLIGDAGPALILLALRGPLIYFVLPPRLLGPLARSNRVRRAAGWLTRPQVALVAWALAYGCWHVPAAYDYAAGHQFVHDLEHASFVAAGFLVWNQLIDPGGHGGLSRGRRLGVAAGVFAMGTVIADVLIFSFRPLYPAYAGQVERVFGLSPLRDQQIAGLVMSIEQILTLGTFAAVMLVPALRAHRRRGRLVSRRERLA